MKLYYVVDSRLLGNDKGIMLLNKILKENSKKYANKTAISMRMGYRTVSLTYNETYELSVKIACFLKKNGVKKGDKVLLFAPNSPYWICVYWGALLRGAILVPLNTQSTPEHVKRVAEQTGAKIIFKHLHYKEELPAEIKAYNIEFITEELENLDCTDLEKADVTENDTVLIMYTSGTTGEPKGVILTHKNIYSNLLSLSGVIPISNSDRFLSILPLSHIYEQTVGFLLPFLNGAKIIYAHSPAAIGELLKSNHITKMAAVPEFLGIIMGRIESKAKEKGKEEMFNRIMALSLKIKTKFISRLMFYPVHKNFGGKLFTVASGGAPLDSLIERKWNSLGVNLLQGYGLTETSPVVSNNTYKENRFGSVGKILPGVKVKIAENGEILVKGPNVFQGYFKNEEKTKEAFTDDGWFKTDDIGEFDKDGFLYIKGRKKYMIVGPGAQNVYPEDIEAELNKFTEVRDSCVVGLEKNGRVEIHATILFDSKYVKTAKLEKIIEGANKKLASYQQINGWSVWPEEDFPRSLTRKIKKEKVLEWLRSMEDGAAPVVLEGDKSQLMRILAEVSGVPLNKINSNTKIIPELNIDSLLRVELVLRIEEIFGAQIEEAKITPKTTVFDIDKMIKRGPVEKRGITLKRWPQFYFILWLRLLLQTLIVFPIARIFVKLKFEGRENLKGLEAPAIFMPNHLSYFDPIAFTMALPLKFRRKLIIAAAVDMVYKKYGHIAWIGEMFFNAFPFPRKEYENIKQGLDYMGYFLDKEYFVVLYPEGRLSPTGKMLPLKRGAGLVAAQMRSRVVPVKIEGTGNILAPGKFLPKKIRGSVTVKFGKPMKFKLSDSHIEVTEKIQKTIKKT